MHTTLTFSELFGHAWISGFDCLIPYQYLFPAVDCHSVHTRSCTRSRASPSCSDLFAVGSWSDDGPLVFPTTRSTSVANIFVVKNPAFPMQAAVFGGMMHGVVNRGPSLDIVPICPSGNCTFPSAYSTLAVCSVCSNITSALVYTSDDRPGGGVNATLPGNLTLQMPDYKLLAVTGRLVDHHAIDTISKGALLTLITIRKLYTAPSLIGGAEAAQCSLVSPAAMHRLYVMLKDSRSIFVLIHTMVPWSRTTGRRRY